MADRLIGIGEVSELLGLSRQRVDQLAADNRAGFPEPVEVVVRGLAKRRLWDRKAVEAWGKKTGRLT